MTRPNAMLFDWDNTLVDSWDCILAAYNGTFRHFGMREWDMAEAKGKVAKSLKDSFPEMFGERWTEARDVFTSTFESIHLDYLRPLPGIEEMLRHLHGQGIYLAVVSNKRGEFLRKEARILGWDVWFGALVGANDAEADKPALAPVRMALAPMPQPPTIQAERASVWFVGDSPIDMHCAINAGCVPALMRAEPPQPGEFDAHPPAYYFPRPEILLGKLHELSVPNAAI